MLKKNDSVLVITPPQNGKPSIVDAGTVDSIDCLEIVVAVRTPHRNYLMAVDPETLWAKGSTGSFIIYNEKFTER